MAFRIWGSFFMFTRAVTAAAVTIIWILSVQPIAQGAPLPADGSIVALNRQLASMVLASPTPSPVHPALVNGFLPRTAVDQRKPQWLSNPTFLALAARFTSAERLLHYRHSGFDANFWGIVNRGRGVRIGFSVRL
jgi:hypothetical protein